MVSLPFVASSICFCILLISARASSFASTSSGLVSLNTFCASCSSSLSFCIFVLTASLGASSIPIRILRSFSCPSILVYSACLILATPSSAAALIWSRSVSSCFSYQSIEFSNGSGSVVAAVVTVSFFGVDDVELEVLSLAVVFTGRIQSPALWSASCFLVSLISFPMALILLSSSTT